MSPSRLPGSRDRDWENGSTASSPASVPEYTGPRLYKEPSAKSNKFIIHNALSHCCLAGKVNEPQKNRILEVSQRQKGLGASRKVQGPTGLADHVSHPPGN